jgi:spore coat protein CotF
MNPKEDESVAATAPVKTLTEKAITLDMLNGAKQAVMICSHALNETQNQQLRSVLERQLTDAVNFQQSVAQFAIQQGYYQPHVPPQQLVQKELREAMQTIGQANMSI